MATKKLSDKEKILAGKYRTKSKIPKTPREREMWKRATAIAAKQSGRYSEKEIPWELVTTIYKDAKKAGKVPKKSDITKAKVSTTVRKYRRPDEPRRTKRDDY